MCDVGTWLAVVVNVLCAAWHIQSSRDCHALMRQYEHYVATLEAVVQQYEERET